MSALNILWMLLNTLYFLLEIFIVLAYTRVFRIHAGVWRVVVLLVAVPVIKLGALAAIKLLPVALFTSSYSGVFAIAILTALGVSLAARFLLPLTWKQAGLLCLGLLLIGLALTVALGAVNSQIAPEGGVILGIR